MTEHAARGASDTTRRPPRGVLGCHPTNTPPGNPANTVYSKLLAGVADRKLRRR